MRIASPFPIGGGVSVVHQQLAAAIPNYQCYPYAPKQELFLWRLQRFSSTEVDIVHAPLEFGYCHVADDVPLVVTAHGFRLSNEFKAYSSWQQQIYYQAILKPSLKKSLDRADKIIAVSDYIADEIRKYSNTKKEIIVIPNGIDTKLFYPRRICEKQDGILRLLFCANWRAQKGVQWLPELAKNLPKNVKLVIASGLKGQKEPLLKGDNIEWLGPVEREKMPDLYHSVDALLSLSISEGHPLVVCEALASGLPIVGWDIPALKAFSGCGAISLCSIGDIDLLINCIELIDKNNKMQMNEFMYDLNSMIRKYGDVFNGL